MTNTVEKPYSLLYSGVPVKILAVRTSGAGFFGGQCRNCAAHSSKHNSVSQVFAAMMYVTGEKRLV